MCPCLEPAPATTPEHPIPDVPFRTGLVLLIGCNPARPADLSALALAALAAADVVLHDGDIDPGTLAALIPRGCFIERMPIGMAGGGDAAAARVQKLAGEGWRVVRLALDDPAAWPIKLAEADRLVAAGVAICTIGGLPDRRPAPLDPAIAVAAWAAPQPLPTGLNGLAG